MKAPKSVMAADTFAPILGSKQPLPATAKKVLTMLRVACSVVLLILEIRGHASASDSQNATTALSWKQTVSGSLTAGSPAIVKLTPCPMGVDTTSGAGYQVLLSGGGNSETVNVVTAAGGCISGASSGTITFTPFFSYAAAYSIGSASSGIQETLNAACGTDPTPWKNSQCNVTVPANGPGYPVSALATYNVYGTIYFHSNQSVLHGYGVSLNCLGRGACLQIGNRMSSNDCTDNTVAGLSFRTPADYSSNPAYAGTAIIQTQRISQVATVTTAKPHGFRVADMVTILFTDNSAYWGDAVVTAVPSSTTFQYAHPGPDIATQATPGVVALAYVAVLDNAMSTHWIDISYDKVGNRGSFNNFFDFWDDENATIDHFSNQAISLNNNVNWTGSFVFSAGHQNHQIAPVITMRDSTITANYSNGITDYNSNGLYVENTVIQASSLWQVYSSNTNGNYQGAYLKNLYSESSTALNPYGTIPCADPGSCANNRGTFQMGEKIVQNTTGAYTWLQNAPAGNTPLSVRAVAGTPNSTDAWVGQTSGAHFYPNALPGGFKTPFPGLGIGGLIAGPSSGAAVFTIAGSGGPGGAFDTRGDGATPYTYYIVANDGTTGSSTSPMQILNWQSTGKDLIPVNWPRISNGTDEITYDVLRTTTPSATVPVPYSGGCNGGPTTACGYVAKGLTQAASCGNTLNCTYQDNGSAVTTAYTVKSGTYGGNLLFWPGSIVSVGKTVATDSEFTGIVNLGLNGIPSQNAKQCTSNGIASPGGYTTCSNGLGGNTNSTATLIPDGNPGWSPYATLAKGRLNFTLPISNSLFPHHIVTLIDSQPALTEATPGYRPLASVNDAWIGTDVPSSGVGLGSGQLAFGAPVSITNYIRATGDGVHANWLERLTAKQKTFAVPVSISEGNSFTLGNGSPLSRMKVYRVDNVPASHVHPQSCTDVSGDARGLTKSDQIAGITPPERLGNLSLNAYPADEGVILFHFCNPSTSEVTTPPGTYSFLAVR